MLQPLRLFAWLLLLVTSMNASALLFGDEPASPQVPSGYAKLVEQLGSSSFIDREQATRKLAALGLEPRRELLAGMRGSNPEIKWRCTMLWEIIREADFDHRAEAFLRDSEGTDSYEFPGWDAFRKTFGPSQSSRQLFVAMQRSEPWLWEEFASGGSDLSRFQERDTQLRAELKDWRARLEIEAPSALTLLYLAMQYTQTRSATSSDGANRESRLAPTETRWMNELWEVANVIDLGRSDPTCKAFKTEWELLFGEDRDLFERMMAYRRADTLRAVPVARRLLRDPTVSARDKQHALFILADSDNPDDAALIRSFMKSAAPIDTYRLNGLAVKSQLRDVALAALILRGGRNPKDFGFTFFQQKSEGPQSPRHLGFVDDTARGRAFQAWSATAHELPDGS